MSDVSGDDSLEPGGSEQIELTGECIEAASQAPVLTSPVGVRNSSNAWWGELEGRTYLVKEQTHNELVSEAVSCLLGRAIGLKVPLGKIWHDAEDGLDYWLSPQLPLAQHWDPLDWPLVSNRDDFATMLVLDALVGNADRHSQNVLLVPTEERTFVGWFIDHSNSAIGSASSMDELGLGTHQQFRIPAGFPVGELAGQAKEAAERVSRYSFGVHRAINAGLSSVPSLTPEERATIFTMASARCADAPRLTEAYTSRITS